MTDKEERELEYRQERMDDRRYANRSAEEVLEEVQEDASQRFGEQFEIIYKYIQKALSDYGLEDSTDDIFENVMTENCSYLPHYYTMWRKQLSQTVLLQEQIKELEKLLLDKTLEEVMK